MQIIARSLMMLSVEMFNLNPEVQKKPMLGLTSISKYKRLRFDFSIVYFWLNLSIVVVPIAAMQITITASTSLSEGAIS
jgi:hypothetical protein